ncbi:MAG: ArsA family ATPase [Actinobacteria bacterium]|nr:ArsA family ATPase [Actinomycetota bacterium]
MTVGTGGVGKTTVSAALASAAARTGRRAVVVTVDPARRLADALGVAGELSSEPTKLAEHSNGGELWGSMLDPRVTFDRLVDSHAPDAATAVAMRQNRIYRNMTNGLSGTQDYLAIEELYWLAHDDRFDLVVVDTPPSQTALDIVDAPGRLTRLFDNRIYQLLTGRRSGATRLFSRAAQRFVKMVGAVVGAGIVDDAVEFFGLFEDLEAGFRDRAAAVGELLTSDKAMVVLVASPRADTVASALGLIRALITRQLRPDAVVVNLVHPRPDGLATAPSSEAVDRLRKRVESEDKAMAPLIEANLGRAIVSIPTLPGDIHDQEGLKHVERHLTTGFPNDMFGLDGAWR